MSIVKISKSSGYIEYISDKVIWNADIYFNVQERSIQLFGTTRKLSTKERDDIITEILTKYAFGNYIDKEPDIWKCKLKNRNQEKYEERKENRMSYSIIGEKILEHGINGKDIPLIVLLKNVYTNLKIEVADMNERKKHMTTLEFKFSGTRSEYKLCLKIFEYILKEIENELNIYTGMKLNLSFINSKYNFQDKNAKVLFIIREA